MIRKRIALDLGNVLFHVNLDLFQDEMSNLGIPPKRAKDFLEIIQFSNDTGESNLELSLKTHFPNIPTYQLGVLKEAWYNVVTPCKETLRVLDELLAGGCEVALLSNIGMDHANYLSEKYDNVFSKCIKHFSCFVGARKPTKLYYQSFLYDNPKFGEFVNYFATDDYGCLAPISLRGLFLDDRLDNVEAARKYMDAKVFDIDNYSSETEAADAMIRMIEDI